MGICSLPDRKATRSKMLYCTRCEQANYCSQECQVTDWTSHKKLCNYYVATKAEFDTREWWSRPPRRYFEREQVFFYITADVYLLKKTKRDVISFWLGASMYRAPDQTNTNANEVTNVYTLPQSALSSKAMISLFKLGRRDIVQNPFELLPIC
jgi:hypothetical protein